MEEQKKETELFKAVYLQGVNDSVFNIATYHSPFLEKMYKCDKSTFLAVKNTVIQSFENIEKKIKEESK